MLQGGTDSQSMLQGGTDSQSMLQGGTDSQSNRNGIGNCLKQDLQDFQDCGIGLTRFPSHNRATTNDNSPNRFYSKTYNYLDTVGEVTNLASGGGTELPLSEIASQRELFFDFTISWGQGERAMNRTTTNNSGQQSAISSQQSERVGNRSSLLPKMGHLKFYLTFVRKCRIIKVASWSEVKPTPS